MPLELECEVCGDTFSVKPSHVDDRKTCSKECDAERRSQMFSGEDNPFYGETFTEESLEKLAESSRGARKDWEPDSLTDATPTTLAYIAGVLDGDGSVFDRGDTGRTVVTLRVRSSEFADAFQEALEDVGCSPRRYSYTDSSTDNEMECVEFPSIVFAEWYRGLRENRIETFISDATDTICAYLRGTHESEGSVSDGVRISVVDDDVRAEYICEMLEKIGIEASVYMSKFRHNDQEKTEYKIRVMRADEQEFIETVEPAIRGDVAHV